MKLRTLCAILLLTLLVPIHPIIAQPLQIGSPRSQTTPATSPSSVSIGAFSGFSMVISSPDYFYNYSDYAPPGLGLRYGMCGMLKGEVSHIVRTSPDFSLVGEIRYSNIFNSSGFSGTPLTSTSAELGMLSFGFGVEQAINSGGRTSPYFGLTLDINEVAPGSLTTTTKDSLGRQTSTTTNLAGAVWQMRFGVTPRIGVLTHLTNALALDVSVHYQVVNLANRADQTPKNGLLDPFGKEPLISQMNAFIGVMWTLPTRGK